jgi:hypothetical protein
MVSPFQNESELKMCTLKSFVIREDYYECVISIQSQNRQSLIKKSCLVSREDSPRLWVGKSYLFHE